MLLTPTAVSRAPVETPGFPALVPRKRSVGPWAQAVAARANREKPARTWVLRNELRMNEPPSRCHPPRNRNGPEREAGPQCFKLCWRDYHAVGNRLPPARVRVAAEEGCQEDGPSPWQCFNCQRAAASAGRFWSEPLEASWYTDGSGGPLRPAAASSQGDGISRPGSCASRLSACAIRPASVQPASGGGQRASSLASTASRGEPSAPDRALPPRGADDAPRGANNAPREADHTRRI